MLKARAESLANVDRLWNVVADIPTWADMLPTFTSITQVGGPDPIDVGSRFDVVQPGLKKAVWEVEVWEPGRGFTWSARVPGVVTTAEHVVEATATGARLDLRLEWDGPLAGLIRVLLKRRAQAMIDSEAATMARQAEADESSA